MVHSVRTACSDGRVSEGGPRAAVWDDIEPSPRMGCFAYRRWTWQTSAATPWPTLGSRPFARAEQRAQIQTSNTMLEQMLNDRVISFESVADVVLRAADPLRLPRLCVPDNDGGTFARWLRWWLGR
jgi:hypothetical protein